MPKSKKPSSRKSKTPKPAAIGSLVVASKVKAFVADMGMRSDGDLAAALSQKVVDMLATAASRAAARGQTTIRPHDL